MSDTARHEFFSITEAAERIGVSRRVAYAMARSREIPFVTVRGRMRVPARALDTWLAARSDEALAVVNRERTDAAA